jgi:hypothetical protein
VVIASAMAGLQAFGAALEPVARSRLTINGDERALEIEPVEHLGDGGAFVRLLVDGLLREHQALVARPGRDHVRAARRPRERSCVRRELLPSMAISFGASGRNAVAQSVKHCWKSSGSIRFITTRSQSAHGVPKWNSEKRRRKDRCASPQSAISS